MRHPHSAMVKLFGLSFLAGVVSALGFAPLGLWPLMLISLAAFFWLINRATDLRHALSIGWFFGLGNFIVGLNWIATAFTYQSAMPHWLGWIAVLLLSLYLALYPAVAAGLAWRYGRGKGIGLVLTLAAAWIVTEWLRAGLFTGFAWNPLAVALVTTPIADLATIAGTYGLSGAVILMSGGLYLLVMRQWRSAALVIGAIAVAVLAVRALLPEPQPQKKIAVRIVQPNIGQQDKWREGFEDRNFARLGALSGKGISGPRLLLWPEAAVTEPLDDERQQSFHRRGVEFLRRRVASMLAPGDILLTGGIGLRSSDGQNLTSATNSIFVMNLKGDVLGRYDKAHLVPYGEYLPVRPLLSAIGLSRLAPGDIDFDAGPGPQSLHLPSIGFIGFQICYEIIFSGEVVDPRMRPRFIFNPSNDAWFGAWGPPQHLAQARLRALEEGLPVLRSTPTGISAVIDGRGRVVASLPWRTAGKIDAHVPPALPPTLFARFGNLLPLGLALILFVIAIAVGRKAR